MVNLIAGIFPWLAETGARVPAEAAFFNLNITEQTSPGAGLDLSPRRLAAVAVESVVAMLHRQERGIPDFTLQARRVDGTTLRDPRKSD